MKEETPGPADKVEDKLNEAGSKFSEWLESNTGVAVGGTTGLLVLVVLGIVVVRLIKRRR